MRRKKLLLPYFVQLQVVQDSVRKLCHFYGFGTIPLPRKLLHTSHENRLVLHVLLVLATNFSWQNGKALVAKKVIGYTYSQQFF